jgi:hypothetical protein
VLSPISFFSSCGALQTKSYQHKFQREKKKEALSCANQTQLMKENEAETGDVFFGRLFTNKLSRDKTVADEVRTGQSNAYRWRHVCVA